MNLKTVKVLLFTLFSLALASLIIGCGVSKPVYFLFTALFAIGYAAVYLLCWLPLLRRTSWPQRR